MLFSLYAVFIVFCAIMFSLHEVLFSLYKADYLHYEVASSLYAVPSSPRDFFPLYAVLFSFSVRWLVHYTRFYLLADLLPVKGGVFFPFPLYSRDLVLV